MNDPDLRNWKSATNGSGWFPLFVSVHSSSCLWCVVYKLHRKSAQLLLLFDYTDT